MSRVFIVLTGAYGNIGDAIIRRRVLNWVRDLGEVHAYVGNAPDAWIEELDIRETETIYRSSDAGKWIRTMLLGRGRTALILDPGQIPMSRPALAPELAFLGLTMLVRLRRGIVVRPPRAFGANADRLVLAIHRVACRLSAITAWRVPRALEAIGVGVATPDTAFQEPFGGGLPASDRTFAVISMRGKRALPSTKWFDGIEAVARERDVELVFISQVREDEARTRELCELFSERGLRTRLIPWGNATDLEHEHITQTTYTGAQLVISDRLHVLILSACQGAVPIELTEHSPSKADEHFSAIGYTGLSFVTTSAQTDDILRFVNISMNRGSELRNLMSQASTRLDELSREVRELVGETRGESLVTSAVQDASA